MKTKNIINQEFKDKVDYYDNSIRTQLKAAVEYRKLSQEQLARKCNKQTQNTISKWITQNAKYKSSPNAPELLAISDILELDIRFFKDLKISCREADQRPVIIDKENPNMDEYFFVKTSVALKIDKILNKIMNTGAISTITTAPQNGSSRALHEFTRSKKTAVLLTDVFTIEALERILASKRIEKNDENFFLLFDNAERLNPEFLQGLITLYNNQLHYQIVFIGKNMEYWFRKYNLHQKVQNFYRVGVLLPEDVTAILKAAFPMYPDDKIDYTASLLVGGISEIVNFIIKEKLIKYQEVSG